MDIVFFDERPACLAVDCHVVLTTRGCDVKYDDVAGIFWHWRGKILGSGHYELDGNWVNCRGTLHRAPSSQFMEGFWKEGPQRGMWRILLG